jgi:hypothetical protein
MAANKPSEIESLPKQKPSQAWLGLVEEQVASIKFGTVQITVHDSRVVQVERVEKVRLEPSH